MNSDYLNWYFTTPTFPQISLNNMKLKKQNIANSKVLMFLGVWMAIYVIFFHTEARRPWHSKIIVLRI
jgi:hypothetical protein